METPTFEQLKDAKAWVAEDAITRAVLPFRSVLREPDVEILLDFLDMLVWTHPFVRPLLTRAGRQFLPERERPALQAAKKPDLEKVIPVVPVVDVSLLEAGLVGKPNLENQAFHKAALGVVRSIAHFVEKEWKRDDYDDLVSEAWITVLEVSPGWDAGQASYVTYLWGRVRNRMINHCKKFSNAREKVASYKWTEKMVPGQFSSDDPVDQFHEAVDAATTSYVVGLLHPVPKAPEEQLERAELRAFVKKHCDALPERQKKVLDLRFDEDMAFPEVAEKLKISVATAERDQHQAFGALRKAAAQECNVVSLGTPVRKTPEQPTRATSPINQKEAPTLRLVPRPTKRGVSGK